MPGQGQQQQRRGGGSRQGGRGGRGGPGGRRPRERREYDQKTVHLARVARVVAGGRRFRFRATVVIGNRKGKVGVGIAKGKDVSNAVEKAVTQAKKNLVMVPMAGSTIPHQIQVRFGGAEVLLKPARPGTGIIAGGAVRPVVELAGIRDVISKMLGSANAGNNVQATLKAFEQLSMPDELEERRGVTIKGTFQRGLMEAEAQKKATPVVDKAAEEKLG